MPTPIPTATPLPEIVQAAVSTVANFWGLPVAVIIALMVIVSLFKWLTSQQTYFQEYNRQLIERSDVERKECNDKMAVTLASYLENQHALTSVMATQGAAMTNQAEAMSRQADAMQEIATAMKSHEDLSQQRYNRHEERATERNGALISSLNSLSVPLERKP